MAGPEYPRLALVVEDDPSLRRLLVDIIGTTELEVVEAESAERALAIMQQRGGEVAFMFADRSLAGLMNGVELARIVLVQWPRTCVVVTSGAAVERLGRLPEAATFLPKPWRVGEVLSHVERAVRVRPPSAA